MTYNIQFNSYVIWTYYKTFPPPPPEKCSKIVVTKLAKDVV